MSGHETWRPHPSPASNEVQEHRDGAWLPVADVFGYDPETVTARQHLIAAAPDLLAACEAALPYVPRSSADRRTLRAAIRRARGES